ncbi:hypothetical protein OROMI_030882 [Orobanche minor]
MAAYGDLASLLNNIEQLMTHPRLSTSVDKNQIQTLHGEADELLNFIIKNNYGVGTKEAEDLERQIASAARVTEDVIESHIVDQIHAGSNQPSHECFLDLQEMIDSMNAVMKKAAQVGEKWRLRENQPTHHDMEALEEKAAEKQPLTTSGDVSAVGLEDDVFKLVDKLLGHPPKRHLISIVGTGGMGKTTLAPNVYNHLLINETFHIRAWATVSQQYTAQEILSQLFSCLGKQGGNDLGVELYQTLFGRKYLIVLDDIWSVEAWNAVRQFFPENENGSRIVLTTRLSDIARDCVSYFCLMTNLLDEDRSWRLLCKKAFQQENCPYPELEKVGKEIASLCNGLPLSIVVIGGLLLNSPKTIGVWEGFSRNIKSIPNAKEKQESLDVLSLSYNHLPPHLEPCFLYMGVFKEDSVISVSKITKLWVCEGFVRPKRARVLEEIAEGYLNDLVSRNLVLVDKFRNDGRIGSCRIHDLLRDLCLNLAQQQDLFNVIKGGRDCRGTERRLVCEGRQLKIGHPLARSIMSSDNHGEPIKYKLLRVLDGRFSECEVFGNVNLRYLNYILEFDEQIPTSLSLIWNLQTLIITPV